MAAIDTVSSASDLKITRTETIDGLENLDTTPTGDGEYTAEELEKEVETISDGNAEALVDAFDKNNDSALDETEIEVMQECITAAAEDGKLADGRLTLKDLDDYIRVAFVLVELKASMTLFDLCDRLNAPPVILTKENTKKKIMQQIQEKSYDLKQLMEMLPQLSQEQAQRLVVLFDKDGDNQLNAKEVSDMKNTIERAMVEEESAAANATREDYSNLPPENYIMS